MLKSFFSRRIAIDVDQTMRQANAFHEQGRFTDAEPLCDAVLKAQPDHFDALCLLGRVRLQQGKYADAEKRFGEALRKRPESEDAHSNRGNALLGLGRTDDALENFGNALAINPDFVPALYGRASAEHKLGRHDAAMAGYSRALAIRPDHVDSICALGNCLDALNRVGEAVLTYGKALAVQPGDAALLSARGNALHRLGRNAEAIVDSENALAAEPQSIAALICLGNALHALGRSDEALSAYDKAIELAPDFAGGPYNRGIVLHALGRLDEAIAAYGWACAIQPNFLPSLFNCGIAQSARGRHEEALACYRQVVATDPDYPLAAGNVAHEQAQLCQWDGREHLVLRLNEGVRLGKPLVLPHAYLAVSQSAAAQHACAQSLAALHHPALSPRRWTGEVYKHDRIRIAYLSADFYEHAVAFLIAGMLEQHDHDRFEVSGVVFGLGHASPMRSRIEAAFDRVVDVRRKTDSEVADLLREMEIDIAVDLMGYTQFSRTNIYASHAAPVQVNFLGFPATMGAPYMDYIIADRYLIPEAQAIHYTENVVYLPDSFQVNDSKRRIAEETPSRSAAGLPLEGFIFCSFNNSYKVTPEIFAIWMRLLQRVPGSVLWLIAANPAVEANLRREAQERGVEPARLVFASRLPYAEYLAQYRLADLFLDTLPYNGGVTISDALWAGLPVVTCSGEAFAARQGGSLLRAVGLPDLITSTLAEYEAMALQLATDAPRLAEIRQRLARNRTTHPLFDTDRYRRNIEAAYVTMWEKTQRGEPPSSFSVPG